MKPLIVRLTLTALPLVAILGGCATQPKPQQPPMPVAAVAMPTSDAPTTPKPLVVLDGDKHYTVDRDRPFKAGESYDVHVQNNFDLTIATKGLLASKPTALKDITRRYDIAGRVLINSLDDKGKPATFNFTVQKCLSGKEVLIPEGKTLEARTTPAGLAITMPDGKKASREITQALLGVFAIDSTSGGGGSNDSTVTDDVDAPRRVGDTWPLKLPPTAKRPVGEGARAELTDIHLTSTLKSLAPFHGFLAAELENVLTGTLRFEKLPLGFTAKASQLDARQGTRFPVDSSLPPLEITRELSATITVEGTLLFIPIIADVKVAMHQELRPVIASPVLTAGTR